MYLILCFNLNYCRSYRYQCRFPDNVDGFSYFYTIFIKIGSEISYFLNRVQSNSHRLLIDMLFKYTNEL